MTTAAGTAPLPSAASGGRLPGLDMLRGIAALCVLGLHLPAINFDMPNVFAKAYLAVDLFFMLSGYVMARTYEARLARGLPARTFFLARYRRLWPVMAIGSAIGLPKLFLEAPDLAAFVLAASFNLLLLPMPATGVAFPLNIPAWSIFFELTANLIHGLFLWRLGARLLLVIAAIMLSLTIWVGLLYGALDVGAHTEDYFAGLPRVLLSYMIGIVLSRWWRDQPPVAISPALAFVAMPLVFASAWFLHMTDWQFDLVFIVVVCPLLIAGGLRYRPAQRSGAIAAAVGALSFPLYAVHMPVLQGMRLLGFGSIGGGIAALIVGAALTVKAELASRRQQRRRMAAA